MLYAQAKELEIDTFVIYTDSETWAGDVHPAQALRDYRRASGIDARLVVVGMVSNGFSIADPNDAGMLDVVGFDTATPQLDLRLRARRSLTGAPRAPTEERRATCTCTSCGSRHARRSVRDRRRSSSSRLAARRDSRPHGRSGCHRSRPRRHPVTTAPRRAGQARRPRPEGGESRDGLEKHRRARHDPACDRRIDRPRTAPRRTGRPGRDGGVRRAARVPRRALARAGHPRGALRLRALRGANATRGRPLGTGRPRPGRLQPAEVRAPRDEGAPDDPVAAVRPARARARRDVARHGVARAASGAALEESRPGLSRIPPRAEGATPAGRVGRRT